MREKRDWRKRSRNRTLSPEKLAEIFRSTTTEKDASETYRKLTGEEIPRKNDRV